MGYRSESAENQSCGYIQVVLAAWWYKLSSERGEGLEQVSTRRKSLMDASRDIPFQITLSRSSDMGREALRSAVLGP